MTLGLVTLMYPEEISQKDRAISQFCRLALTVLYAPGAVLCYNLCP